MPDFLAEDGRLRLVSFILEAEMPPLLKPRDAPLACWEPLADFEAVNTQWGVFEFVQNKQAGDPDFD